MQLSLELSSKYLPLAIYSDPLGPAIPLEDAVFKSYQDSKTLTVGNPWT
jgi:hypothetical protein